MKQSKEQIEAYRAMAQSAPQSMNDIIKQHLTENCPKFKDNEDKFDRCIKHLYETVLEMLGGKDAADDENKLEGTIPADTVFRICRDYFDDEVWKAEDEEEAKKKEEEEKKKAELDKEPTTTFPKVPEKPKKPEPKQLDFFAMVV